MQSAGPSSGDGISGATALGSADLVSQIGVGWQILLHLAPGALATLAYVVVGRLFYVNGLPSILGFYLASVLILFPIEIGLPIVLERRRSDRSRLSRSTGFRYCPRRVGVP